MRDAKFIKYSETQPTPLEQGHTPFCQNQEHALFHTCHRKLRMLQFKMQQWRTDSGWVCVQCTLCGWVAIQSLPSGRSGRFRTSCSRQEFLECDSVQLLTSNLSHGVLFNQRCHSIWVAGVFSTRSIITNGNLHIVHSTASHQSYHVWNSREKETCIEWMSYKCSGTSALRGKKEIPTLTSCGSTTATFPAPTFRFIRALIVIPPVPPPSTRTS